MADQVGQFKSAHGEATGLTQQRIERRAIGCAFLQQAKAFGVKRPGDTVNNKSGRGARVHRFFAPGLGGVVQAVGERRVTGYATDHFHQRHDRRRVEKMQAEQAVRVLEWRGDGGDRQ